MRIWIPNGELKKHGINMDDANFSEILTNYLQDNYFNGADSAIIYLGEFKVLGIQELEIIPC